MMKELLKRFGAYCLITVLIFFTAKYSSIEDLSYLAPRPPVQVRGHEERKSNTMDFFDAIEYFAGQTVVLTTTNAAFVPFARNWLEYLRRIPNLPPIIVVAEDTVAFDAMKQYPEVTTVMTKRYPSPTERLEYLSKDYIKLINKRPTYIKMLLDKDINVLFSDVDTIWLENPFPYLEGNYDVILQEDQPAPEVVYCAGFIYFKATELSKVFMDNWMQHMAKYRNMKPDQKILNLELAKRSGFLRPKILNVELFPNGKNFFDRKWRMKHKMRPVVIHNNWVETLEEKFERFNKMGLWLIPPPVAVGTNK